MIRVGRRQFLGALAGSMALLPMKRIFTQRIPAPGATNASGQKPLKAAVIYYSATGSTAKVAMAIHRGMKSSMDCDLLKLKKADPGKLAQYDVIGFGGPIFYFRDTANLKLFIHKMPEMDGKLSFLFCTHGSEPIGFFDSLGRQVIKKKFTIIGWNDWFGSVYQVLHMPKPYLTDGHPDEIDLKEAEAFGREMAERAQKISAGDRSVIPDIPLTSNADPLWIRHDLPESMGGPKPRTGSSIGAAQTPTAMAVSAAAPVAMAGFSSLRAGGAPKGAAPSMGGPGGGPGGGPPGGPGGGPPGGPGGSGTKLVPVLNMATCVYPRCNACVDICPVSAIDMSLAVPGRLASSPLIIKEACISCGLCERLCVYDAITFQAMIPKSKHAIDMKSCTYPQCKLCVEHCPMDCIDFSTRPPTFHQYCEGCDLCYSLCPHDSISVTNFAQAQLPLRMTGPNNPFAKEIDRYEAAGRFRRLVPIEKVGFDTPAYMNTNVPRIVLNQDDEATYCDKPCKA